VSARGAAVAVGHALTGRRDTRSATGARPAGTVGTFAAVLEIIELGPLSLAEWIGLTGRDPDAFGDRSAGVVWRPKDRHVAVRDEHGKLAAVGGVTVGTVSVGGGEPFPVVGFGGLIVRRDLRGSGLMTPLMDRLVALGDSLGPDRALIFCEEPLVPLYTGRSYTLIESPVRVDQPDGRITMPIPALWRPIRPGPPWPAGPVEVDGLPF
jgi:hypothetical protein